MHAPPSQAPQVALQPAPKPSAFRPRRGALCVIPGERVPLKLRAVLAAEILIVYVRVRWRMPRTDLRDLVTEIRTRPVIRRLDSQPGSLETRIVAARLGNAVNRTLMLLPTDSRCLVQSLVLAWLLAARGIFASLVIGAHSRPEFAAHAWLEHCGRPVLSPEGFDESRLLEI